jgi:fatty acid desaturase
MTPRPELLPNVLPAAELTPGARLVPELRSGLRGVPNLRNAVTVAWVWAQAALILGIAAWVSHPLVWLVAFALMTRVIVLASILSHEAAHRLLFSNRALNDLVGRWLLSYPTFVPYDAYRRVHMAHHREAFGPNEPDMLLYGNYPSGRDSMRRKLVRDATGLSGLKLLRGLFRALLGPSSRRVAASILAVQVAMWLATGFLLGWWVYPLMWLLPWLTAWRVLARLRAVAEHGGMRRSDDEREVTHHVRQRPLVRIWLVPYNTGWHLAHHVDPGLSFRALPEFHGHLEASGWVPPELVHRSYPALWAALAAEPEPAAR